MFPEVALIHIQCGFAIKFIQHVVLATRHLSGGTERRPATERTMRKTQLFSIQTDANQTVVMDARALKHPSLLEGSCIASQPAGDWDISTQNRGHPGYQGAAVDRHTLSKNQHRSQARQGQLLTQTLTGRL